MTDGDVSTAPEPRGSPVSAPPLRRPRSRARRLRLALRHEPKRLLYPLLALGRGRLRPPAAGELAAAERILVLRELHTLGDALLATPTVRALGRSLPDAELGLVTGWRNAAVWAHNPHLDRRFVLQRGAKTVRFASLVREIRAWGPQVCVTLESVTCHATLDVLARASGAALRIRYDGAAFGMAHTNGAYTCLVPFAAAAGPHQIDVVAGVLRPFGVELDDRSLEMVPGAAGDAEAARRLAEAGLTAATPFAVLHPGSKQVHNRWPLEGFLAVRAHLIERGFRVLLSFGPSEEHGRAWFHGRGVAVEDLLPPLPLEALAALLARAALVVCPDTGILHVAAAVGARVVGLYGSGDPTTWRPPGRVHPVGDHSRRNVRQLPVSDVLAAVDAALVVGS